MGINFGGGAPATSAPIGAVTPVNPVPASDPVTPVADNTIQQVSTPQGITLDLGKGAVLDLTKRNPGLRHCRLGAGWDPAATGVEFDLDISAFLLNAAGKITTASDIVYFNNKSAGGVTLNGDNRNGLGEGDDETMDIDLGAVPAQYDAIVFCVNIFEAQQRQQTFGMVQNSYVRLLDKDAGDKELCRFRLKDEYATSTGVVFAKLKRSGADWNFEAIGDGKVVQDLNSLVALFT